MKRQYGGYMGRVCELDLTACTVREYPWTDRQRELYIGGKSMGARILYDCLTGREKPLSPENIIVISTGPLTGTGAPSSGRFNISTLSPQTGYITSSSCGGTFGYYLKKAGMDALIIRGKSPRPLWIEIRNGTFTFHNGASLWGTRTSECQQRLAELVSDKKYGRLCIGPAGEHQVLYASVVSDERIAGRTGIGAVFGYKNLKALTVAGNHQIPVFDEKAARAWSRKWFSYLRKHPITGSQLPRLGTAGLVTPMQMKGLLSTKNYQYGRFEDFESVCGEVLAEEHNTVNQGCLSCPIRCGRTVTVAGCAVKGPELETLGLLGGGILNNNLQKLLDWNHTLDELGMDTISAAGTLAWAMEANERGLWNNGLEFGKLDGIDELWEDIAFRRGIGDELAEGSRRLSEKYGGKDFAIQVKGLELAAYEPRRAVGQGLGYAVANRGGCHINGGYLVFLEGLGLNTDSQTPRAKADFTMLFQDLLEMISASGQCIFTSYGFFPAYLVKHPNSPVTKAVNTAIPHLGPVIRLINRYPRMLALHLPVFHHTRMLKYAVGLPMNFGRFIRAGERGYNIDRLASAKFGVSARDDTLPGRLTDTPQDPDDPRTKVPLAEMKKTYYKARGWDSCGLPKKKTLKRLEIEVQDD